MKISKNRSAYADFRYLCRGAERLCDRDINGNSKSTLRRDLLLLDTTDRVPVCTAVVVAHSDIAAAEAEAAGVVADRSRRPIATVAASTAGIAAVVVAVTGSREEYLRYTCCI
jgi:hypothetical protein